MSGSRQSPVKHPEVWRARGAAAEARKEEEGWQSCGVSV